MPKTRYVIVKMMPTALTNTLKQYNRSTTTISIKAHLQPRCALCLGARTEDKIIICPNCMEVYHVSCLREYKKAGWDGTCLRCHYPIGDILEDEEYMQILNKLDHGGRDKHVV